MFKKVRWWSFIVVAILVLSVLVGCQGKKENPTASNTDSKEALKIAMITDTGGLGDGGFNDITWAGLEKARDELGCKISVIESDEAAHYGSNIDAAAQQGNDIIVCVGSLFVDVIAEVAPHYPEIKFVLMDDEAKGDNIYSFVFNVQEASYLAGVLAGLVTEENKFGCVGGMEIPVVVSWYAGYAAGVKTIKPEADVVVAYVGSFGDPGKTKEMALAQYNNGAAVVMEISSGGSIGVAEAARDMNKKFISCDKSKDSMAPGFELTAAICRRDLAMFEAIRLLKSGTVNAGTTVLSSKDGIFTLPDNTKEKHGDEVMDVIEKLQKKIVSGDFVVPRTIDELASFKAPTY